jgi:hypothetical protein
MAIRRTRWEASFDKHKALKKAEESGMVADSTEYRTNLVQRFHAGEITFEQMQAELKQVKRTAKKNGQLTRSQAYSRG